MSGWTAVDDTENDVEGEKVEGPVDDVANDEDVIMEIEESDEAYQSRLSMNYRAALTDQSKSLPGTDVWENAKELYLEILEDSDPSMDPRAERLATTAEISASDGLTILHRLRYLCFKNLGKIYYKEKCFDKACRQLRKALSLDDRDVMLWYDIAASFAKHSKLVEARYHLEKALAISPHHTLSLRRLCEILGPDGLDDSIGLNNVYRIIKSQEEKVFKVAANFYDSNNSESQSFQCIVDGGWGNKNVFEPYASTCSTSFATLQENFQKNQSSLFLSDPWIKKTQTPNTERKDINLLGTQEVVIKERLDNISVASLGVLLINLFEHIHSEKKQFVDNVIEIELGVSGKATPNPSNTNAVSRNTSEDNDKTGNTMVESSSVLADRKLPRGTSEADGGNNEEQRQSLPPNVEGTKTQTEISVVEQSTTNGTDDKPQTKSRMNTNSELQPIPDNAPLAQDTDEVKKASSIVDNKKTKVRARSVSPKRTSKRIKLKSKSVQSVVPETKPIRFDITESLKNITLNSISALQPSLTNMPKSSEQASIKATIAADGILKQCGKHLISSCQNGNITSHKFKKPEEGHTLIQKADMEAAGMVSGDIGNDFQIQHEFNYVLKMVKELNSLKSNIVVLLQHYCQSICVVSKVKFSYKTSAAMQKVQSAKAQLRNLKLNTISDVISKAFVLLTEFHKPLACISTDIHVSADGLNPPDTPMTAKKREKIATRLRNLHPGTTQNIHTGNGVHADALAWLTSAEMALDQAVKQKMSIHGARSSEFYKQKASRKIKWCRRCLKEMWLVLSGNAISLHGAQNTDNNRGNSKNDDANITSMATFLNKNKAKLASLDTESSRIIYERIKNGEMYLKAIWEGRLRYYWLCAQLDKLNERHSQSLLMLKCCAVTLNENKTLNDNNAIIGFAEPTQEMYYINHCIYSNTIDHRSIVRRLDELASKATIDRAIKFYKEGVELDPNAPNRIFPASVASADPVVSSIQQNLNGVEANQASGISKSDIIKKRRLFFANTLQELKQRYLPDSSGVKFDDDSWTCHCNELVEDFFNHRKTHTSAQDQNVPGSRKKAPGKQGKSKVQNAETGRRRRKKRVIDEEPEVRPDLITIVVESCLETGNTLLGFKFLGRVMSELATVGSTVDTAIEYLLFLKQNHLPFFARSPHNNKVSKQTDKGDDDVDTESESFHIFKRQQAVEQTYVFCLHVFETMHNLAISSCENSETNGRAALLSIDCWEILSKVLSPYIQFAKLLDDKDIFSYIDKISTVLHQDSFRLALSWKSCKMYSDELLHHVNDTNNDRHQVSVTMLQHSIGMALRCIKSHVFASTGETGLKENIFLHKTLHQTLFSGFLYLALDLLSIAKKVKPLRYFVLDLYFSFACSLVPAAEEIQATNNNQLASISRDNLAIDRRHACLREIIRCIHFQLGSWRLTISNDGEIIKNFVHILTIVDKWNAHVVETNSASSETDHDVVSNEATGVVDKAKETIDMLGMSYYDLYGFVIDVAFRTDRMYTPPLTFLPIYNPSTHDKALTRQFCVDLFDFSNERIQSKTSGTSTKEKRFILAELYKVLHIDVWHRVTRSIVDTRESQSSNTDPIMEEEIPFGPIIVGILQGKENTVAHRSIDKGGGTSLSGNSYLNLGSRIEKMKIAIEQREAELSHAKPLASGERLVRKEFFRLFADMMQSPTNSGTNEKNQELYDFYRVRMELLLQDLSYNPKRARSWQDLGISAVTLLNNRIDASMDLTRNSMTKLQGKSNIQTTMNDFRGNGYDYYFVNRSKLHTIALHSFHVALALSNTSGNAGNVDVTSIYEQIAMIKYNDMRCIKRKPTLDVDRFKTTCRDAFSAFENANRLRENWVYNLYMGKLALKLDRNHAGKSALNDELKRGLLYLRKAYDLRTGKNNERPTEYTLYRLLATIIKGTLKSHKQGDEKVLHLLENAAPDYDPISPNGTHSSISNKIELRRYHLLRFSIQKMKTIIRKSVSISDHRPRFMVAFATYYGQEIVSAAEKKLIMDEQNHSEEQVSTNIDSIDRSEWGIDVSLYHLRSYFASTRRQKKKSEADSRSSQNANLKYYNQLVGLWFEQTTKDTTIFDSLEQRHFKYNYLREKYIVFYIKLLEERLFLLEMGQYLQLLEKQSYDKKVLLAGKTLIMHFISYHVLAMYRVLIIKNDVNKEMVASLDENDIEETLRVAYKMHLAAATYGLQAKDKITHALIETYDIYEKCRNQGGASKATLPEIFATLEAKFPKEHSNSNLIRAKNRLGRLGGGRGGLKLIKKNAAVASHKSLAKMKEHSQSTSNKQVENGLTTPTSETTTPREVGNGDSNK